LCGNIKIFWQVIRFLSFRWYGIALSFLFLVGKISAQCEITITTPEDMTICNPQLVSLNGQISGPYITNQWASNPGGVIGSQLNPSVFVSQTTTFTLTAGGIGGGQNVITNGNFEMGNVGFFSDYIPSSDLYPEGRYHVGPNPNFTHGDFANCADHTSGSGNMMIVNGSVAGVNIWCQTVPVIPNTTYVFEAWATSVHPSAPAVLQFSIGGTLIGNVVNLPSATCQWTQFYQTWFSGSNTSIEICITNQNTQPAGNDFAIDDIYFAPVCESEESFTVTVAQGQVDLTGNPELSCNLPNGSISASFNPFDPFANYQWSTPTGQIIGASNDSSIGTGAPGLYQVTVTSSNSCTYTSNFVVSGNFATPNIQNIQLSAPLTCQNPTGVLTATFSAAPGAVVVWSNQGGGVIGNGTQLTVSNPGTYFLTVTNSNGCSSSSSITVQVQQDLPPVQLMISDILDCSNQPVEVSAVVNDPSLQIQWTTPTGAGPTGVFSIETATSGSYIVTVTDSNGCTNTSQILLPVHVTDVESVLTAPSVLTCAQSIIPIYVASEGQVTSVQWSYQGEIISEATDSILVDSSGWYYFTAFDERNCPTTDSIFVFENFIAPTAEISSSPITCPRLTGVLTVQTSEWFDFQVSFNGQNLDSMDLVSIAEPGIYQIQVTDPNNGCSTSYDHSVVTEVIYPDFFVEPPTITCLSPMASIQIQSIEAEDQITITGPESIFFDYNNPLTSVGGFYQISVVNIFGCETVNTIEVFIDTISPEVEIELEDITCQQRISTPTISSSIDADWNFSWTLGGSFYSNEQTPNFMESGQIGLQITDASSGCTTTMEFQLEAFLNLPVIEGQSNGITCDRSLANIEISSTNTGDFLNFTSNDIAVGSGNSVFFTVGISGVYEIAATNEFGCRTLIFVDVPLLTDGPVIEFVVDTITCEQPLATFNYVANEPIRTVEAPQSWTSMGPQTFQTNRSGLSQIDFINENGCRTTVSVNVAIDTIRPSFSLQGEDLGCNGEPGQITILTPQNLDAMEISFGGTTLDNQTSGSIVANSTGNYRFFGLNMDNGCSIEQIINIGQKANTLAIVDYELTGDCDRAAYLFSSIQVSGGVPAYRYQILGESDWMSTTGNLLLSGGDYTILVEDAEGCRFQQTFDVPDWVVPSLDPIDDLTIDYGDEAYLSFTANIPMDQISAVQWGPSGDMTCPNCFTTYFQGLRTTPITLNIQDQNGCEAKTRFNIDVRFLPRVTIPNVISPGNGTNGIFAIFGTEKFIERIESVHVFDRWGNNVYSAFDQALNDRTDGWDGRFRGGLAVAGVYAYAVKVLYTNGESETFTGDVTVLY